MSDARLCLGFKSIVEFSSRVSCGKVLIFYTFLLRRNVSIFPLKFRLGEAGFSELDDTAFEVLFLGIFTYPPIVFHFILL